MDESRVFDALTESMEETRRRDKRIVQLEAELAECRDKLEKAEAKLQCM